MALRKVEGLLEAGANVLVVAPQVVDMPAGVTVIRRPVRLADLDEVVLAVCASGDAAANAALASEAHRRGVLVNVVDDPEAGTFTVPAVLRRGRLQVAVSTGGASPLLARRLRDELAGQVDDDYAALVDLLAELRRAWEPRAVAAGVAPAARRAAWQAVLDLPLLDLLHRGDSGKARSRAAAVLEDALARSD